MVHTVYHPLKHHPLRKVFGWCTVGIILLKHCPLGVVACMVHSRYHPLKNLLLRIGLG